MDKIKTERSRAGAGLVPALMGRHKVGPYIILICCSFLAGCATMPPPSGSVHEQMDAAKKVVGALAPQIDSVEKYSPLTGKHYSGALEYEPGTGVKLEPVE